MSTKLYVGNLPFDTNEADLESHFAQAGAVASVSVMRDRETGRARGFAFVEMATEAEAQAAIAQSTMAVIASCEAPSRAWMDRPCSTVT